MGGVLTAEPAGLARFWAMPDAPEGAWGARLRLGEAVRALALATVRTEVAAGAMDAAAEVVRGLLSRLPHGRTAHDAFVDGTYFTDPRAWIDRQVMMGRCNPLAPPMVVRSEGDRSLCELVLSEAYVGAPGMVHGGLVAALFDQMCGHAVVHAGTSGFTVKLDVTYQRPTRVNVPLVLEAAIVARHGRTIELHGTCRDAQGGTASCTAIFAEVDPARARAVIQTHDPSAAREEG